MTWDTLDNEAYCSQSGLMTISGGGLTATAGSLFSPTNHGLAMPNTGKFTGKAGVEIHCITPGANDGFAGYDRMGVVGASAICNSGGNGYGMIGTTGGAGFSILFGLGYSNTGYGGPPPIAAINNNRLYLIGQNDLYDWPYQLLAGDYGYILMDLGNNIWFRVNNGPWLGSTDTGDPAAGTGGVAFSYPSSRYFPAVSMGVGGQYTFNFGATPFQHPLPAGFTAGWTNTDSQTSAHFGSFLSNGLGGFYGGGGQAELVSPYICPFNGVISELIGIGNASDNTKAIGTIRDSDGAAGAPKTLLSSSQTSGGLHLVGTEADYPLDNTVPVAKGHLYYLGVLLDTTAGPYSNVTLAGGVAGGLYVDTTPTFPTPNANFVVSSTQAAHIPMLATGVMAHGYTQGHIF